MKLDPRGIHCSKEICVHGDTDSEKSNNKRDEFKSRKHNQKVSTKSRTHDLWPKRSREGIKKGFDTKDIEPSTEN